MTQSLSDLLIEENLSGILVNPRTGHKSRTFSLAGKADRVDVSKGQLIDWKSVADPAKYLAQKSLGYQAEMYAVMLKQRGIDISSIEYRLIKKPTIRLKKTETPAEYTERCVDWLLEDPTNMVTDERFIDNGRLRQAESYLWAMARQIRASRKDGYWMRNERACWAWNRACDYLPLCEANAAGANPSSIIDDQFEKRSAHTELDSDDNNVLTYSSTSCMADCPAKYFWRYEECLRVKREEIGGALWLGSLIHDGLEVLQNSDLESAMKFIDDTANEIPFLGEDEWKKIQQEAAKAKAIVTVVPKKWEV